MRPSACRLAKASKHLLLERGVADREHLVDQQHLGLDVGHQREAEADEHPRGVVLELHLGELLELGELDHLVEARSRLARREPHHHAVERDVLVRGELGVEADPELDAGRDPAGDPDRPGVGAIDAGEQLEQRALAGAVAADDAEELDPRGCRSRFRAARAARGARAARRACVARSFSVSIRWVGIRKAFSSPRTSTAMSRASVSGTV